MIRIHLYAYEGDNASLGSPSLDPQSSCSWLTTVFSFSFHDRSVRRTYVIHADPSFSGVGHIHEKNDENITGKLLNGK